MEVPETNSRGRRSRKLYGEINCFADSVIADQNAIAGRIARMAPAQLYMSGGGYNAKLQRFVSRLLYHQLRDYIPKHDPFYA